jgi:hypothetical protein
MHVGNLDIIATQKCIKKSLKAGLVAHVSERFKILRKSSSVNFMAILLDNCHFFAV